MITIEKIKEKITQSLHPTQLNIEDDSHKHATHNENPSKSTISHLRITVISTIFNDKTKIARHKVMYKLLKQEFEEGLHALQLTCLTPEEWKNQ